MSNTSYDNLLQHKPLKTFKHSGKAGDIIFSLPTIELLCGGAAAGGAILYIPEHSPLGQGLYSNLKPLLEKLPYIHEVRELESMLPVGAKVEGIDVDLDKHLEHPWRGRTNMVQRYFDMFGIKGDWQSPWLEISGKSSVPYTLINLTPRFRDNSRVDWKRVLKSIAGLVVFVGTSEEYDSFCNEVAYVDYWETPNAYQLALVVAGAQTVYCNQSMVMALSASMGKEYHCEFKPGKLNCRFYTPNEHILT